MQKTEKKQEQKTFPRVLACECAIGVQIRHVVKNGIATTKDLTLELWPMGVHIFSKNEPYVNKLIPFANIKELTLVD